MNGITRTETDNNIRKIFGTIEDFLLTSMASQLDSLSYLNEGSTRRKEILAKFLDLQFFDRKFRMCNEDSVDLKGAIKKLSDFDYEVQIKESRTDLARTQTELSMKERQTDVVEKQHSELAAALEYTRQEISIVPKEVSEYKNSCEEIEKYKNSIAMLLEENSMRSLALKENSVLLEKIENFLSGFDIDLFNKKKDFVNEKQTKLIELESDLVSFEEKKKRNNNKIDLLKRAPCGIDLKKRCHFVSDARHALDDVQRIRITLNQLKLSHDTVSKQIFEMNPDKISKYIEKYYTILEKKSSLKENISSMELEIEKDKVKLLQLKNFLAELESGQLLFEENKKSIESLQLLLEDERAKAKAKGAVETTLQTSRKKILDLYKETGSLEQKYRQLLQQKEDFASLQDEYTTADLFLRCMHPNGISYDIIKKRLPLINSEISKILTNIVDFEIFFENEEAKLDILIKHPSHDPRPIEIGSGAEKTIAAMAIRLALLNVSTLPKGDLFILDEPGTALDAENMEGFVRILEMIKGQFKTVLLISHLDSLKDIVDDEITIEKFNGKAFVSY